MFVSGIYQKALTLTIYLQFSLIDSIKLFVNITSQWHDF